MKAASRVRVIEIDCVASEQESFGRDSIALSWLIARGAVWPLPGKAVTRKAQHLFLL